MSHLAELQFRFFGLIGVNLCFGLREFAFKFERTMGIEQIRMNQTKALPPAFPFNWSQWSQIS
jgi:hypothetical protein